MNETVQLLSKLLSKDILIGNLEQAIQAYKEFPVDTNYEAVMAWSILIALKEHTKLTDTCELLSKMASDKVPFLISSAN